MFSFKIGQATPLEAAARCGEELIVELLLANKANTERSESASWGSNSPSNQGRP